jgi:hypothetical protein
VRKSNNLKNTSRNEHQTLQISIPKNMIIIFKQINQFKFEKPTEKNSQLNAMALDI